MTIPVLYWDPDHGLLFDEPWLVSPSHRWRLVPLKAKGGPVHYEPMNAFFEYEGENTPRMLVQFDKDWLGRLSNPVIAGTSARRAI